MAQACQRLACGVLAHRQVLVGHRFLLLTNSYFRVTIFIGPSLATLVTHSVTDSRLVDLIDVTLACEDANSKLVEVVTVAETPVDDSLVQNWKLKFGYKVEAQARLEAEVWSVFCC